MKRKTVKTSISRLLRRHPHKGRYEQLAMDLGISSRWVRILEKGEQAPSEHLRRLIRATLRGSV